MNNFILYKYKMSLLPTDIYTNQYRTISNISQSLSTILINNSTITTNHIILDGNTIDTTGSGGGASILLNGVAVAGSGGLTSSIANWAQFGANSTITVATGGGTGGRIEMTSGNISTLNSQALTVSSINGASFTQATTGVSRAVTGNISVSNTGAGFQTLTFSVNNNVPMTAGTWYMLSAKLNTTLNSNVLSSSNSWYYRFGLSGGTLQYQQDSPVFIAPVVWAQQNSNGSNQFSYFFTSLGQCANSGSAATLSVIADLAVGTGEDEFQWSCPAFTITPLGPALN
jgi:hypothetical protein